MPQPLRHPLRQTLRQMSAIISDTENRPEEPIFNQLKGLLARGFLQAIPDLYGKKGALIFAPKEAYRARMLLSALDNGFTSDVLAHFSSRMDFVTETFDPITRQQDKIGLDEAISDLTNAPENDWTFVVARYRVQGEMNFDGRWTATNRGQGFMPDWTAPDAHFEGITTFAFTRLCAPLHAKFGA